MLLLLSTIVPYEFLAAAVVVAHMIVMVLRLFVVCNGFNVAVVFARCWSSFAAAAVLSSSSSSF